ncbi:response regulator [Terrimonas pollutisoli]|uniref:response regulator n=1 Tax=Terrimonas pollutisoli TaxID=3034147 RepID=UPI0023EDF138|nr:response regulator transcription factor [Terrimonas sp. H1YJ31]
MLRIIIADDHPVVMQALKKIVEEEFPGVYVEEVSNTPSLLEKVLHEEWDLVISDLAMPGGGGLVALKKIKAVKKKLPVLILSTYPADQYATRLIKAGAEDFISKDGLPGDLIKSIRVILGPEKKND